MRTDRFADVWSTADFVAAIVALVGVVLVGVGQWTGRSVLGLAGAIVVVTGAAAFIRGRVGGRSDSAGRHDGRM